MDNTEAQCFPTYRSGKKNLKTEKKKKKNLKIQQHEQLFSSCRVSIYSHKTETANNNSTSISPKPDNN